MRNWQKNATVPDCKLNQTLDPDEAIDTSGNRWQAMAIHRDRLRDRPEEAGATGWSRLHAGALHCGAKSCGDLCVHRKMVVIRRTRGGVQLMSFGKPRDSMALPPRTPP
jgi:hypothetical protein